MNGIAMSSLDTMKFTENLESSKSFSQNSSCSQVSSEWRRYHLEWRGQNTFLCEGRVIGGPEIYKLYRTFALLLVPSVLFDLYVAEVFLSRYNEQSVMIFGVILPIICVFTLIKTAFTDPGIIPRKAVQRIENWSLPSQPPKFQDICIQGTTVRIKFCSTCKIFRPPRSYHCPICDNCVERFDHHCPWIGTCIGLRNYGYFTCFL